MRVGEVADVEYGSKNVPCSYVIHEPWRRRVARNKNGNVAEKLLHSQKLQVSVGQELKTQTAIVGANFHEKFLTVFAEPADSNQSLSIFLGLYLTTTYYYALSADNSLL